LRRNLRLVAEGVKLGLRRVLLMSRFALLSRNGEPGLFGLRLIARQFPSFPTSSMVRASWLSLELSGDLGLSHLPT
jgi:hypothetical protein